MKKELLIIILILIFIIILIAIFYPTEVANNSINNSYIDMDVQSKKLWY